MNDVAINLKTVNERIAGAAKRVGRDPEEVKLLAVTKTHPAELVRAAYEAGHRLFGENYAQELEAKANELPADIEWHFIGTLQRNKVKKVLPVARVIHSVDRMSLAREINKRASGSVEALVEVNLGGEETKTGAGGEEAVELVEEIAALPNLKVVGLMTMPPFFDDPDRARPYFRKLRELRDIMEKSTGLKLPELSMGMTGDMEAAIEEGATIVRVGTAIFGPRKCEVDISRGGTM